MRITRLFVLLALAALLSPPAEASLTSVSESNRPSALTATRADAAGLLTSLAPAARLDASALANAEVAEPPLFNLGDVILADTADAERFDLGSLDLLGPAPLRGPPPSYPETRVGGFELLPPFRVGASPTLSLWGRQACGFSCGQVASDSRYDPWGLMDQSALTKAGEQRAVELLREQGWQIFWGGSSHRWNGPGADIFAYRPASKELAFFGTEGELAFVDDKNTLRKSIGTRRASALTKNMRSSVDMAREAIAESNMPSELKGSLLERLRKGDFDRYVSAAADRSRVERVTEDLAKEGVKFLDLKAAESAGRGAGEAVDSAADATRAAARGASRSGKSRGMKSLGLIGLALTLADFATATDLERADVIMGPLGGNPGGPTTEEELRSMYEEMYFPRLHESMKAKAEDERVRSLLAPAH